MYLALGSSLGDKNAYLDFAIGRLRADDNFRNVKESERIVTLPYGNVAKNEFVNSVAECETLYSPRQLIDCIAQVEKDGDRGRVERWGERRRGVGVWVGGDEGIERGDLCGRRPDMQNRLFVLKPLGELCPNKVHPLTKKRVHEMLSELEGK